MDKIVYISCKVTSLARDLEMIQARGYEVVKSVAVDHPKALPKILDYGVDKIVYISCKVTSLARDLEMIQARGYEVVKSVAVDQFCQTVHVETVVLLQRETL